jgi:hypothetical protein
VFGTKDASTLVNSLKQKHFWAEVRNFSELNSITYEVRRFHPCLIIHETFPFLKQIYGTFSQSPQNYIGDPRRISTLSRNRWCRWLRAC